MDEIRNQSNNPNFESQTAELQSSFESHYDSGKKGQDPLKGHFAQKNLEAAKNKTENHPSLGDAENLLKQKRRFKISADDEIFKKHQEVSDTPLEGEGIFEKGQPSVEAVPQVKEWIMTCRVGAAGVEKSCVKKRIINLTPPTTQALAVTLAVRAGYQVKLTINFATNDISLINENATDTDYKPNPLTILNKDGIIAWTAVQGLTNSANVSSINYLGSDNGTAEVLQQPNSSNGYVGILRFLPSGAYMQVLKVNLRWDAIGYPELGSDTWEGCEDLERQAVEGFCEMTDSEQQGINEPRSVSNYPIPVTREYWSENKSFICGAGRDIDECESLVQQKCQQIESKCAVEKNNICVEFESTFKCDVPDYLKGDGLQYKNGNLSFLKSQAQANGGYDPKDFGEAVTQFSALTEMGKKLQDELGGILGNPDDPSVFHGRCSQCRVTLGSLFRDCCKLKGILQGLFGKCNEEEKKLAIAAIKNKRCVKVEGRYCHKKKASVCLEKRDSYCCYGSQLARIIQEIAHHQLNIPWGDAKSPNCASLTASQLSQIDFDTPYAQAKLAEILAEMQATAQEKFELVQNAVANLGDVQGRAEELQKNQEDEFARKIAGNEIPKNEHGKLETKMKRDVIIEEQNAFKEKVRLREEQRAIEEGKKELELAKKYIQRAESRLVDANKWVERAQTNIANVRIEIEKIRTTLKKDCSLQRLKVANDSFESAKTAFQSILNGNKSLAEMLIRLRLNGENLEKSVKVADKTAIRKEMEANSFEIDKLYQALISEGVKIGSELQMAKRYLESAQKVERGF